MKPIIRVWGRIREFFTTQSNALSRSIRVFSHRLRSSFLYPSHDWGRPDYPWWRKVYYCKIRGLEISGLLIKPLVNKITGWVLGISPIWSLESETAAEALNDWWREHQADILKAYQGSLKQGDSFMVVNSDLTISLPPPETVSPIVDEMDYSKVIGWRVLQVFKHPDRQDRMSISNEYYVDRRIRTVQVNSLTIEVAQFENLLGVLPIIHIANNPDEGEEFGHPEAEAPIEALHRYGEVFEAAVEGNISQGRPTPVINFESIPDLNKFWELYGSEETVSNSNGTTETVRRLDVDLSELLTLSAATFDYKSPGSFTQDTERLLGLIFYLFLEYSELPEFIFGNAITSSKASAETQMPVFERFIELRRASAAGWMTELAIVVLGYLSLLDPEVLSQKPIIQWRKLTQDGKLTLDTLIWAYTEGLIDERTALLLAPLDIQDIDKVLEVARKEREEKRTQQQADQQAEAQFDRDLQAEINDLAID